MTQVEPDADYRTSHLDRGTDYDSRLATAPFDRYMMRQEPAIVAALVDRLFPDGVPRYLDFACGTGRMTALVEPRARESYAVDVSESMIAKARLKCPRTRFFITDVTRNPPDLEPMDLVTAFRFFANAQGELRDAAADAVRMMLRPGGYLILNNHRNSWSIRNLLLRSVDQPSDGRLSHLALRRLLARHNFRILRTVGVGVWLVRAKVVRTEVLESRYARMLEPLSRLPVLAPICPDEVVLAQRVA